MRLDLFLGGRRSGFFMGETQALRRSLGPGVAQGEYERGRHSRGTGEQVRLAALRPLVQREWLSARQALLCVHLKKSTCVYNPLATTSFGVAFTGIKQHCVYGVSSALVTATASRHASCARPCPSHD
jgi:hypothetical protein